MNTRWSLRQLFLWIFIIALVIPYLLAMVPKPVDPLTELSISSEIESWLREVDSTVQLVKSIGGSSSGIDSVESDQNYLFVMDNASSDEMFDHLTKQIREKIKKDKWLINESVNSGGESRSFICSKGPSHFRLYVYRLPLSGGDSNIYKNRKTIQIKLIKIGYTR